MIKRAQGEIGNCNYRVLTKNRRGGGCFKEKLGLDPGGHQDGDPHRRREPYGKTLLA